MPSRGPDLENKVSCIFPQKNTKDELYISTFVICHLLVTLTDLSRDVKRSRR